MSLIPGIGLPSAINSQISANEAGFGASPITPVPVCCDSLACTAGAPFDCNEIAAVGEDSEKNEEDNRSWDPGPELVGVHYLIAKGGDGERADGDNDNASRAFDIAVDCLDELGADDRIDGGPADAGQDVENGNCQTQ